MSGKRRREPISHNVSVRFREAEAQLVERLAYEDDMSMGAWIRRAVLKVLTKRVGPIGAAASSNGAVVSHDE